MRDISVSLWFRFNEDTILHKISDCSQIQYFEFEEWMEYPPRKFLNVGSKFKFENETYEIIEIRTNLDVIPYENVSETEIGTKSTLAIIYYIKKV